MYQLFTDTLKAGSASFSGSVGDNDEKNQPNDAIKIKAILGNIDLYEYGHFNTLVNDEYLIPK